ncbi:MAG: potassium channel family protein [Phycisphaerae bacterium]
MATGRSRAIRVIGPLFLLFFWIIISSIGYWSIEPRYSFADGLYMTIITVTTTGFHEVHALGFYGRVWTMIVLAGGLVLGGVVLTLIGSVIVEGRIRRIFGRRQLQRKIATLSDHVIVCGYGDMGEAVAGELHEAGKSVVIVDANDARTTLAEKNGLLYVLGEATEDSSLEAAGIARASALISLLDSDASNVFVTLSARQLNSKVKIIARAKFAGTQDKLRKAGASRVVCPQTIGATRIADVVLRPALVDFVEMTHQGVELEMDQLEIPEGSWMEGRSLAELALPKRVHATVVAMRRADGRALYSISPDMKLQAGDTLILVGQRGAADAAMKLGLEVKEEEIESPAEQEQSGSPSAE